MRRLWIAAAALLLSAGAAFAADPVCTYRLDQFGRRLGLYRHRHGRAHQTFQVVWVVGGVRYTGTGIGDKELIAVSYRSGNDTGLALYGQDGGNWLGLWTVANGRNVGTEVWKRR
jgi:hypothetical protein